MKMFINWLDHILHPYKDKTCDDCAWKEGTCRNPQVQKDAIGYRDVACPKFKNRRNWIK